MDIEYNVKSGDTLYLLAKKYGTTVSAIIAANPGIDFRNIQIGRKIIIPQAEKPEQLSAQELRDTLRKLWEQHVAWTRMTIISIASDNPDLQPTTARLLRNATDMAMALKPLYGEDADKFGELIKKHLIIAAELVNAAKAGNSAIAESAEKEWYANADEIAAFLHSINPYISQEAFKNMLYSHLAMTKAEAVARLERKYAEDIAIYDKIEEQALLMADTMADGITKQFLL